MSVSLLSRRMICITWILALLFASGTVFAGPQSKKAAPASTAPAPAAPAPTDSASADQGGAEDQGEAEDELAEGAVAMKSFPVVFEAKGKATLSAKRAGVLTLLKYEVGSYVKRGNTIAKVDPGEPALLKKRAESQIGHLKKRVGELTRLYEQGLSTNKELSNAKMELDMARTSIKIYNKQIADSYVRAPFSGKIIRRHVKAHEWVADGQPVVDIVDLSAIRAVADIPADVAVTLKKGDVHSFYIPDLAAEMEGTTLAVSPEVDERSNTARVIWRVKKGKLELLPGMKGEVRIEQ